MKLYHHPFTRASNVVWMLEEAGLDYHLEYVDIRAGAQKAESFLALNPMGKVPTLVDGSTVLTESAAIGLYLGDRGVGVSPPVDDPLRAQYYRWILFGPSVVEPCAYAHSGKWDYRPGSAGWGTWEAMHATLEHAIGLGPWLLGDEFSMADVCLGGTIGYLTRFGMVEKRPAFMDYLKRLEQRSAFERSAAINARIIEERGLGN